MSNFAKNKHFLLLIRKHTCAYQRVKNVSFPKIAYVPNKMIPYDDKMLLASS